MPTLLSVAGVDAPKQRPLDGVDLSPILLRQETLASRPLYWGSLSNSGNRSEALRQGVWKLVVQHPKAAPGSFENEKVELYNLNNDPAEQLDVAAEHPELSGTMLGN